MKQEKETKARIVSLLHIHVYATAFVSFVRNKNKKFNRKLLTHIFLKIVFSKHYLYINIYMLKYAWNH